VARVEAEILAGKARLLEVSRGAAERYGRRAAGAWARFGPAGFARWLAAGEALAAGPPPLPEAAVAYFDVDAAAFGADGVELAEAWAAAAREVGATSRRLAAVFLERTVALLGTTNATPRLGAWASAALRLHEEHGWQGSFLALAFLEGDAAAPALFGPAEVRAWATAGAALATAARERDVFRALPPGLAGWTVAERCRFFGAIGGLAAAAPRPALAVFRGLPPALGALAPATREAVGRIVAALDPRVAPALAELVPVVGAIVAAVPASAARAALESIEALAARHPEAALAALRQLARLHDEARPGEVQHWFAVGARIADENPAAGRAYFGLESRTSLRVLHAASTAATLEETQGVWRKLVQMLSGAPVVVRGVEQTSLRPPLEERPDTPAVALPERVDLFATHEENCRLYRVLAATLAGRRAFGTYADPALIAGLRAPDAPELLEDCFLLAEGVRIQHRLGAAYPGLAADVRWASRRFLAAVAGADDPPRPIVVDALLAIALVGAGPDAWPPWLPRHAAAAIVALVAPVLALEATAGDALAVAHRLVAVLAPPAVRLTRRQAEAGALALEDLGILDPGSYGDEEAAPGEATAPFGSGATGPELPEGLRLALAPPADEPAGGGRPLSLEELRRLLAAGATVTQAAGEGDPGPGLSITDLEGKIPAAELDRLRKLLAVAEDDRQRRPGRPTPDDASGAHAFLYDEWDEAVGDYRARWCRLLEVDVPGDSGEYFSRTLADYSALIPEIRRQFQRLRPEMYRSVRGLEDGEDFDLNAVVDARTERRARRAPSTKLYRSRVREARDVATLFLLDLSASTDEPVADAGRRIIDVTKEALVVMTQALDALGDAYAIYGFSGQGRANVEVYPVKGFNEPLGPTVKGRIGGLEPKRSTRMGTALRHATAKLVGVGARMRHLILLSDGFPQDVDYGDDRRSHAYGIRDTAVALREAEAAGITPFCITVDRAGHDYLRQMCDPKRYLVIEDVASLPRELPKIYQRVVRA
jgi:hypothetical protein